MSTHSNKALVIGAGFAGLSAASFLAKKGWSVTIVEKNEMPGGRARKFEAEGFTFDMGPSWYWMPDVLVRLWDGMRREVALLFHQCETDARRKSVYRTMRNKARWTSSSCPKYVYQFYDEKS